MDALKYPPKKIISSLFFLTFTLQLLSANEAKEQSDATLKAARLSYYVARIGLLVLDAGLAVVAGSRKNELELYNDKMVTKVVIKNPKKIHHRTTESVDKEINRLKKENPFPKSLTISGIGSKICWSGNTALPWLSDYFLPRKQNRVQKSLPKQLLGLAMQLGGALLRFEGNNFWYDFGREGERDHFSYALFFSIAGIAVEEYGASLRCANSGAFKSSIKLGENLKRCLQSWKKNLIPIRQLPTQAHPEPVAH